MKAGRGRRRFASLRSRRSRLLVAAGWAVLLSSGSHAEAKVFITAENAVCEAFPGLVTEKRTDFLTDAQIAQIETAAGTAPASKIILSWRATKDSSLVGTAYLDTHLVRTLPESILVVIGADARVVKVEILSFDEPPEYLPRARWLQMFEGKALDQDLSLKGHIRGITGATLSSRAITAAVRRVLATHNVLVPSLPPPPPQPARPSSPSSSPPPPSAPPSTAPSSPSPQPSPQGSVPSSAASSHPISQPSPLGSLPSSAAPLPPSSQPSPRPPSPSPPGRTP